MDDIRSVRDKRELFDLFSAAMANAWSEIKESQRLLFGQNLLKTYVIETDRRARADWPAGLLAERARVAQQIDPSIAIVADADGAQYVLERIRERFTLLHSLATAATSDAFVDNLTSSLGLDRIWLSASHLERIATMGALRGFTTRYDRSEIDPQVGNRIVDEGRPFPDITLDPDLPVESLRLRLWGSEAPKVLNLLRHQEGLARATSISAIRLRYFAQDTGTAILDELDYTGRFTSRGSSYDLHRNFVERIVDEYAQRVTDIEKSYRISLNETGEIDGQPMVVGLDKTTSPRTIAGALSRGVRPFRFIGVQQWIAQDYVKVAALDLHGGHAVDFEIAPEMIRIYLRGTGCGNSLMRLQATLQHHLDARFELPA